MNIAMETSHRVIPAPDPPCASGKALSGGYIVHPAAAGPASTKNEITIITLDKKKSQ